MSTNKNTLVLIRPEDPPAELIQKALDRFRQIDLAEFGSHLETARSMWRKFRELVEAPEFPEQLRAAFVKGNDYEPDDAFDVGEAVFDEASHRETYLPQAIEIARGWMLRLCEEDSDAKFLSTLGISGEER